MAYVYLLGDWEKEGIYKIGVTRGNIENRIKKLQTGNSGEIYLVSYYETKHPFLMENILHGHFNANKVMGEWFEMSFDDVRDFKKHCKDIDDMFETMKDNYYFSKKYGTD